MVPPEDESGRRSIGDLTRRIRTAAGLAKTPSTAVTRIISEVPPGRSHLPLRYQLRDDADGPYLTCVEASNIRVRIERGVNVSSSSARKAATGTIFLDGAAQGEPFMDAGKGVYNLDHHEGCVRPFTLATCEQAMVVILKGLDLSGERWTVNANDPDFDTVLAIWLLLNHRRLSANGELRRRMMPVVRLQGAIDAHGLELAELTGFPHELQTETLTTINRMRESELELKKEGTWDEVDFLEFTAESLQQLDELVYSPSDFEDLREVEELARVWIAPQRFALACRSESGIYEVEEHLKEVHADRLGLVVLARGDHTFTLRQTDPFLPTNLESLYERLNLFDPAAGGDNRWGGSGDIGGSPRATGTGLSVDEIMGICRWVYTPPSAGRRLGSALVGLALAAAVLWLAVIAAGGWGFNGLSAPRPQDFTAAALVLLGLASALALLGRTRFPGHFGLRPPRGIGFLALLPLTIAGALGGGVWAPINLALTGGVFGNAGWWFAGVLLAGVVGLELLCRGVLHGIMVTAHPIMLWSGRRFVSVPNAVAAVASTAAVVLCFLPPTWLAGGGLSVGLWIASALAVGLACGYVRERSRSVWAAAALHALSVAAAWWLVRIIFAG